MYYSGWSGNGQIKDENYYYFLNHLPRIPIIGARVKLFQY